MAGEGSTAASGGFAKLASPFREFGRRAGTLYLADRVLGALVPGVKLYAYEMMAQPITDKPLLPASFARHLSHRLLQPGDPEIAAMPARDEIKAARFADGSVCLGVYMKDKLVGYIWFSRGRHLEDEVRCTYALEPAAESVFDFDLVVLPEYRMGIGFAAVWQAANTYLRESGVRQSYSRLTRFNLASRRSHAHLGWRRVAAVAFLKIRGVELMVADMQPWIALTWGSRRSTLRLRPDVLAVNATPPPNPNLR